MNAQKPLDQLRDIHLPEAISMWPPAPGWWVISALALSGLFILTGFFIRRHRSRLYRRQALESLRKITTNTDYGQQLQQLFILLRQTAQTAALHPDKGGIAIDPFIDFLRDSSNPTLFSCERDKLKLALYAPPRETNEDSMKELCMVVARDARIWIMQHRVGA